MKTILYMCVLTVALLTSTNTHAQTPLAQNSTIISIGAVHHNQDKFYIKVNGGTGPCTTSSIFFPASGFPNPEAHQRAYGAALTAFAAGTLVEIYSTVDATCNNANFILITKP